MSWRPVKVLFIGDEPSSKNVDPAVPFVGTASYKRLLNWIGELDLDIQNIELINKNGDYLIVHENYYDIILFLGKKAETLVYKGNSEIKLPKIKTVDHPSPRNRKFNNPAYEKKMLKQLKEWIYDGR